jgi:Zn-finger nucleic acid-binding protein
MEALSLCDQEVKQMNCPVCKIELKIAERQGIEIDFCPQCRGVWLDRGELDKIIERSILVPLEEGRDSDDRRDIRHHRDDDRDDRKWQKYSDDHGEYRGRRRKSFLGELFDF